MAANTNTTDTTLAFKRHEAGEYSAMAASGRTYRISRSASKVDGLYALFAGEQRVGRTFSTINKAADWARGMEAGEQPETGIAALQPTTLADSAAALAVAPGGSDALAKAQALLDKYDGNVAKAIAKAEQRAGRTNRSEGTQQAYRAAAQYLGTFAGQEAPEAPAAAPQAEPVHAQAPTNEEGRPMVLRHTATVTGTRRHAAWDHGDDSQAWTLCGRQAADWLGGEVTRDDIASGSLNCRQCQATARQVLPR